MFRLPIRTETDLRDYVTSAFGVTIPATQVCPEHSTPWRAFADAYFARHPVDVWIGSRGFGGKSYMLALLGLVEAQTLRIDVNVLGGSGEQSKRVHDYMHEFWNLPTAPRQLLASDPAETRTRLVWGNTVMALKASQASVRGPHPVRLKIDECDTVELDILDAALGQPMSKDGVTSHTVLSGTHHVPDGTMTEILKRAAEKGWSVHRFCWRETSNPLDGWLAPEDVDRKRQEMTAAQFAIECDLGEPSAEGRAILTEAVDWTFRAELGESDGAAGREHVFAPPVDGAVYATGADWARKQDYTVIDTLRCDVRPFARVAWSRMHRLPWPEMVAKFNQRCARYPGRAAHDGTGVGDAAHAWITGEAEPFVMVGAARRELFVSYIAALESQAIVSPRIMPCESAHRYTTTDDLFGAGHPPDEVVAGALAYRAASGKRQAAWDIV